MYTSEGEWVGDRGPRKLNNPAVAAPSEGAVGCLPPHPGIAAARRTFPPVLRRRPAAVGESKPGVVHLRLHQQQALKSAASVPTSAFVQFDASGSGRFGA